VCSFLLVFTCRDFHIDSTGDGISLLFLMSRCRFMPFVPARFPKDFESTLMSVACVEAVLAHDGVSTSHSWEASRYGFKKRIYDSGPKTRGSMQRNRSGEVVVSFARLAEWEEGRPSVSEIKSSILWSQLRRPRVMVEAEWRELEGLSRLATHSSAPLFGLARNQKRERTVLNHLAACGTFDAIAALWSLYLESVADEDMEFAFQCARYALPALGLLAGTPVGERIALLLFARLRQRWLDDVRWNGQMLSLNSCDLPAMRESALYLSPLEIGARSLFSNRTRSIQIPLDFGNFLRML
jgi:hypothetical protein